SRKGTNPPHTRGSTRVSHRSKKFEVQPPAHAGINPAADDGDPSAMPTPRTRGDQPGSTRKIQITHLNPPHTRGSTRPYGERHGTQTQPPAHAGINPGRG